ncbi:MAG: pyridoxal phosphate-dependent aminotransferase family protein [Candidatus Thermoplasmatota archaeon]|nr:pyridoxal phosphate-dependent aminotransferase family protein [Candidatus Thermoplasmatota archaeon]
MNEIMKTCKKYKRSGIATIAKKMGLYPYFHPITSEQGPLVKMEGKEIIMLGSNNYLGMTGNNQVKSKAIRAMQEFGVGTTGSRLLNGTFALHDSLEQRLAKFLGKQDCVIFSTGMQANLGTISSLLLSIDDSVVISDELNHASIIDGITLAKLPKNRKVIFSHNDANDLKQKLKTVPKGKGIIITEGVFSMEGDVPPLDKITELAKQYDAMLYVDDAHGIGVLGPEGRGAAAKFKVTKEVDILMGTFSKSFASSGGYIAADKAVCNWVRHHARSFIFSASMPPANCATVHAVLDLIENDNSYRENLLCVADKMRKGLDDLGFEIGLSTTPIIPIIIGDEMKAFKFYKKLFNHKPKGIFTNPVRAPAVPKGRELMRTSYMATMTEDLIDDALSIFETVGKKMKFI